MEIPDPSAMLSVMEDLNKSLRNIADTQRKMLAVTGTAWSPDRFIKAVVGPRGQLIDLEIDPKVYRKPNSAALAQTILATVRAAVEQATEQTQALIAETMPAGGEELIRSGPNPGLDMRRIMRSHDADLKKIAEEGEDVELR